MVRFKKMYDDYVADFESVSGDYLVDETGYEPLVDLLKRCIRDSLPLPTRSPGLVEDIEADNDMVFDDRIDQVLFPEDYEQPSDAVHSSQINISDVEPKASEEPKASDSSETMKS